MCVSSNGRICVLMCGSVDLTHVLVLAPLCMFMGMCVYLSMCVCTWVWRRRVRRGWDRPRVSLRLSSQEQHCMNRPPANPASEEQNPPLPGKHPGNASTPSNLLRLLSSKCLRWTISISAFSASLPGVPLPCLPRPAKSYPSSKA